MRGRGWAVDTNTYLLDSTFYRGITLRANTLIVLVYFLGWKKETGEGDFIYIHIHI
jgi:hypothetical protein